MKTKRLGWKIGFGVSWIPAFWLYGNLIYGWTVMPKEGIEGTAGGIAFIILLIPSILFLGIQIALGYLAFRR